MAEKDQGEKTEEPTQQRREDFRKRGQVAQSKEFASVLALFTGALCLWLLSRFFLLQFNEVFVESLTGFFGAAARQESWIPAVLFAAKKSLLIVAPFMGMMFVMSFMSTVLQIGFLVNEEALQFKAERIDPVQGFKRIFSLKSLVEGLKAIFKVTIVIAICGVVIKNQVIIVPQLVSYSVEQLFVFLGEVTFQLLAGVGVFLGVLAGLDFLFQRWDLEQKMKMTKQEVKEEHKSREGDPLVKARIRRVQREMASKRMMDDVPKADVVITNPTHIAVALRYSENMVAPTVVAKGAGLVAEKIKKVARDNSVPVMENKPLARTIFKTLEIGQVIPKELYTAVAEVLSYVFRLKKKRKR